MLGSDRRPVFLFVFLCLFSSPAYAYLDPGTGSLLLQGAIAAIAGALVFLRSPLGVIKEVVRKLKARVGQDRDA